MNSCKNIQAKKIYKEWFDTLPNGTEFTAEDVYSMLKTKMRVKLPVTQRSITYIVKYYGQVSINKKKGKNRCEHIQNYNVYKKVSEDEKESEILQS